MSEHERRVHLWRSTFGYTVAINGEAMPMDLSYAKALAWVEKFQALGFKSGPTPPMEIEFEADKHGGEGSG